MLLLGVSVAWAESDGSRSRVLADRPGGTAALGKQLGSIRSLERQRRCGNRKSAGLFDPCRALAAKRSNVEREMAGSGRSSDARTKAANASLRARARGRTGLDGRLMFYCVRLSDGYFFPAPNAQFVGYGAYDNTLDRCRFICRDPDMEVFVLDDSALETDTLRRLRGGISYAELPVAFSYREDPQFRRCDFGRYVSRSNALQVEADPSALAVPLPKPQPHQVSAEIPVAADTVSRPVRVVGLPFLPDNDR